MNIAGVGLNSDTLRMQPSLWQMPVDRLATLFALLLMFGSMSYTPLRYFGYGLPLLALLVMLANRKASLPDLARPFLLICCAGLLMSPFASNEGLKDLYLALCGISMAMAGVNLFLGWWTLFIACVGGLMIFVLGANGAGALASFNFDVSNSASSFESGFAFVFGLLAIWAAHERKWWRVGFAILMVLLSLKRIAVIAVVAVMLVQLAPRQWARMLLRPLPMLVANLIFLALVVAYGSGKLDLLIYELTGQSANQFGMGRRMLYMQVAGQILADPWSFAFVGSGPGAAYDAIRSGVSWIAKENLHSDVLKVFFDYGFVFFSAFICLLYSSRHYVILIFGLYANLVFLTDNTLTYPYFIFFLLYISTIVLNNEKEAGSADVRSA